MPGAYRIRFTVDAADHLTEIFNYIERDSPQNARNLIDRILNAIDALADLPHRYKVMLEANNLNVEVRSMPVPPYLVRYHIDDRNLAVTILSVRHGARRPGL
jgi:plasmid stabilization system protein ParE